MFYILRKGQTNSSMCITVGPAQSWYAEQRILSWRRHVQEGVYEVHDQYR